MSDVIITANVSGTAALTLAAPAVNTAVSLNLPNQTGNIGYSNIPVGTTFSGTYTIQGDMVGKMGISNGANIIVPSNVFAAGDCILFYNNSASNITITCSAPTTYVAGTNTVVTSATLLTRGVVSVLYVSATSCVLVGSVF